MQFSFLFSLLLPSFPRVVLWESDFSVSVAKRLADRRLGILGREELAPPSVAS